MKAVVKKVMDEKLSKPAWIGYASRVIKPMRTVWSQWNYNLTTKWFKIVLLRTLNSTYPAEIVVETISRSKYNVRYVGFAKLGNQIYCIDGYPQDIDSCDSADSYCLAVCEVEDMTQFSEIIFLPLIEKPDGMAACKRSNSIYIWQCYGPAVWLVVPKRDGWCEVLRWADYSSTSDFLDCFRISGKVNVMNLPVLDDGNLLVMRHVF